MDIEKLMIKLDLGSLTEEPAGIKGVFLHKMYRVSTSKEMFAVKELNPEITRCACIIRLGSVSSAYK